MQKTKIDIGQKFNMLTVLEELPSNLNGRMFKYRCECGTEKQISYSLLTRPTNKSCGCYRSKIRLKHGMWESREYSTWENMIQRCTNENSRKYYLYGGRGISVCERWLKSFADFYQDMGDRPENTTLDRIDGNKGYYKENCKWSNPREQLVNVRHFHQIVKHAEEKQTVEDWISQLGIDREDFKSRIIRGLGFKESLFCTFDIIALNVLEQKQYVYNFQDFLNLTKFKKEEVIKLLDTDHVLNYHGYVVRYLTGFNGWPILTS